MKEQRRKYTILNLSLGSPESLLRATIEPEKKRRDVTFKDRRADFTRSQRLKAQSKGVFERRLDPFRRSLRKCFAETLCLLSNSLELRLHEFVLQSN